MTQTERQILEQRIAMKLARSGDGLLQRVAVVAGVWGPELRRQKPVDAGQPYSATNQPRNQE